MKNHRFPNPQSPEAEKTQIVDYRKKVSEAHYREEKRKWERNVLVNRQLEKKITN